MKKRLIDSQIAWLSDVVVVLCYLVVADLLLVVVLGGSVPRAVVALPLLLFLPGYAIVVAAYPRHVESSSRGPGRDGIPPEIGGWKDYAVLSFGVSLATITVLGVVLGAAGFGLDTDWLLVGSVQGIVLVGLGVGVFRRARLPRQERFRTPVRPAIERLTAPVARTRPLPDRAVTLLLVLLVLLSVGGLGVALVSPPSAEEYTTMMLLTENESGEYVAGNYPTNLTRGEPTSVVVGIENREGGPVEYTVVPIIQRVRETGNSVTVEAEQELDPIRIELDGRERAYETHTFTPRLTGSDLRLVYLLYVDGPPADPSIESSDEHVHVWVDVSESRQRPANRDGARTGNRTTVG